MAEQESGSRRPGFVETLREGWKPGHRRTKAPEDAKTTEVSTAPESAKTTEEATATKSTNGTETQSPATKATDTKPAAAQSTAGSKPPEPNLGERMEGLQGWMAEIERRQRRMTFFAAVGTVLAVLAAGAALYLAITTPNSASTDDLDDLEAQVETLEGQVTRATTDQARLKALNSSLDALGARVAATEQRQNQQATEIAAVKAQAQAAQQAAATATPAPAPVIPTTPGTPKQP